MALPSSNPQNKVSVAPVGVPINIAAYSPDPARLQQAFDAGMNTTQKLGDSILIRPAQATAEVAQAKNLADEAKAMVALRPLATKLSQEKLAADINTAKSEGLAAERKLAFDATDEAASAQRNLDEIKAKKAVVEAEQALNRAVQLGAGETNLARIELEQKLATAKLKQAQFKQEAEIAERDLRERQLKSEASLSETQRQTAQVTNPAIQQAQTDIETAQLATQRMQALIGLARTVATGTVNPTAISPEQDQAIRTAAQAKGVTVIDPAGRPRPIADVSREYSQRVNVEQAEPVLKELRNTASEYQRASRALKQISGLGKVPTGFLYTLPGVKQADKVLAQLGVADSAKREFYEAMNRQLVPLVRDPGGVSNFEQVSYTRALPGPGVSETTNAALLAGLFTVAERNEQRPAFYTELVSRGIPVDRVEKIWSDYVDANPSLLDDNNANSAALTPKEYLEALSDPENTARRLAPTSAEDIDKLPLADTDAQIAAVPESIPFVAVTGPRGQRVAAANPSYWRKVLSAAGELSRPADQTPAATSEFNTAFQSAIKTPAVDQLRALPSVRAPVQLPMDNIRPRK